LIHWHVHYDLDTLICLNTDAIQEPAEILQLDRRPSEILRQRQPVLVRLKILARAGVLEEVCCAIIITFFVLPVNVFDKTLLAHPLYELIQVRVERSMDEAPISHYVYTA
jgi:hypothetical protein